jgi:hypothetical protein
MPSRSAVEAAIRGAPGVDSVKDLTELAPPRRDSSEFIGFAYWGRGGAWGNVQFIREAGRVDYTQEIARMGGVPSQREVDATLPIMAVIEARLESLPGLAGLRRSVKQHCYDVRCP